MLVDQPAGDAAASYLRRREIRDDHRALSALLGGRSFRAGLRRVPWMSISALTEAVKVGGFGGGGMVAYGEQRRTDLGLPPVDATGPVGFHHPVIVPDLQRYG
jgi:hypothetical protein